MEWRPADGGSPAVVLDTFLHDMGLGGELAAQHGDVAITLLLGATACAAIAGLPTGSASPVPAVPELVAVAVRRSDKAPPAGPRVSPVGEWTPSWSDADHALVARIETTVMKNKPCGFIRDVVSGRESLLG